MSINGAPANEGGEPLKVGVAIADIMTGMYAATAILAALQARSISGDGQFIEVPLYDCQVAWLANQAMNYLVSGVVPERLGSAHPNIVPYQSFATRDGYLMLAVGNDGQFGKCMVCLELEALRDDPRYATNPARVANRESLVEALKITFARHDTGYWLDRLLTAGVPAGPINDLAQVFASPYVQERGLLRSFARRQGPDIPTVANPVRFSGTPARYANAPPWLGEQTEEVMQEWLNYSPAEIDNLKLAGAIWQCQEC
jgi:crotonobetainyl-CoA:carnitine CoA-transferase CaiB-like acyl-CoA transferase